MTYYTDEAQMEYAALMAEQADAEMTYYFGEHYADNTVPLDERRFIPESEVAMATDFTTAEWCDYALGRIRDYLAKA